MLAAPRRFADQRLIRSPGYECSSFVAAATQRILLGTGVLLLPCHHPVVLAKRLATMDVLSAGRMRLLTVGIGAQPGEAQAVGVGFSARGRRADEAIDVLRLLWAGDENGVRFHGEFFSFDNLCSFPKPSGVTHLPIHIGGSSRAAARRAGRRGDGYFPGGALTPDERASQLDLARSTAIERPQPGAGVHPMGIHRQVRRQGRGIGRARRDPHRRECHRQRSGPATRRDVRVRRAVRARRWVTSRPPLSGRSRRWRRRVRARRPPGGSARHR